MNDSQEVLVYSTGWCPYCAAAKALLDSKNVEYREIDLTREPERRAEMEQRSKRRSVPQIFVGDRHIGGFDDLNELNKTNELDRLLLQTEHPNNF